MTKPELLSPAGNPEKLSFALLYGADAVYCALERFGMRSAADNFTPSELAEGIKTAHSVGAKLYLTLNTMPGEAELSRLPDYLSELTVLPDAFIISDPGVMETVLTVFPDAVIHLSTQANTLNSAACRFWYKNGVKRIVLARELSLAEIAKIRAETPPELELECFVHGAMCVSYSGRCLLSNYYTGRNANNGSCTQPCRWKYFVREEKRQSDLLEIEENPEGTYLFSSRDMCMIEHIPALVSAGITSFKIEGRVKSAYYAAVTANAYRMAIDGHFDGRGFNHSLRAELESVSHREYGTGYFFSSPYESANIVGKNEYIGEKSFLCTVSAVDNSTGLAKCVQRNKCSVGDRVNLLSPGTTGRDLTLMRMFDADMNPIESAPHAKMEFFAELPGAMPGDILRSGTLK